MTEFAPELLIEDYWVGNIEDKEFLSLK